METKELQKLAAEIVDKLDKKFNIIRDAQFSLAQLVEELGELAKSINSEKLRNKKSEKRDLEEEFADVLIQVVKLADLFNVDLEKSVLDKIKILKERHTV